MGRPKGLRAAAETFGNWAIRSDALDALAQVREGAPFAFALAGKKCFPGLLSQHFAALIALNTEPSRDPRGPLKCAHNGRITAARPYRCSLFKPSVTL